MGERLAANEVAPPQVKTDRRRFIKRSLVGGVFLSTGLVIDARAAGTTADPESCANPSTIDSLGYYVGQVNALLTEILLDKGAALAAKVDTCRKSFERLFDKVKELKDVVCQTGASQPASQLCQLAELGRDSARSLKAALRPPYEQAAPLIATLSVVSAQLRMQAQAVQQDEVVLKGRAPTILKELFQLLEDPELQTLATELKQAQTTQSSAFSLFAGMTNNIRQAIEQARKHMINVENPFWQIPSNADQRREATAQDREAAREAALTALGDAFNEIKSLIKSHEVKTRFPVSMMDSLPESLVSKMSKEAAAHLVDEKGNMLAIDALLLSLTGARLSIVNFDSPLALPAPKTDSGPTTFVPASLRHARGAQQRPQCPPPTSSERGRVSCILWDTCPPGTDSPTDTCLAILKDFQRVWLLGWILPDTFKGWIKSAIERGTGSGQLSCTNQSAADILAGALLKLVTG